MTRRWIIAFVLCASVAAPAVAGEPANATGVVPIESVIKNVKQALAIAQNELDTEGLPAVRKARLQLEAIYSTELGGGASLFITKVGAPFDRTRIQKLTLDLNPRRARGQRVSSRELEETLSELIVSAARGAENVRLEPTPLKLTAATAQLNFVVQKAGAGGLGYSISPVTAELDADLGNSSVQVLTLTFVDE
ncbi:MAG: hypothetical protein GY944_15010 [bacterium]|nr:hypothetical protein [bacterium]